MRHHDFSMRAIDHFNFQTIYFHSILCHHTPCNVTLPYTNDRKIEIDRYLPLLINDVEAIVN